MRNKRKEHAQHYNHVTDELARPIVKPCQNSIDLVHGYVRLTDGANSVLTGRNPQLYEDSTVVFLR